MTTSLPACDNSSDTWPLAQYPVDPTRPLEISTALIETMESPDRRTRDNFRRALARIDSAQLASLIDRHRARFIEMDPVAQYKYADIAVWAYRMVALAQHMELDRSRPLHILDIGMGSGAFSLVAQSMGHSVIGTDVANPWYDELCALQQAIRIERPVVQGEPYRVDGGPFDLITIVQPAFHRRSVRGKGREYWGPTEWGALLTDLANNLLKDDGRIVLVLPMDKAPDGSLVTSPMIAWSAERGARLSPMVTEGRHNVIEFDADAARRLQAEA